ncbi:MAG TPA: helix-turn-helix transcriptional regulator, partial [Microbacteriaceae bacterium]
MEDISQESENLDALIIGKRIRALRNEKGMNLDTLAEILSRATSYVSGIETGKKDPKLNELQTIAKALGVELDELI